jgi:hypothetical protein
MDQSPEPVSLEQAIVKLATQFGATMEGAKIEKLDVRIHTETVTDPTTLIPVSVLFEKKSEIRVVEKGKPEERSAYERREWKFACQ